jgi:hypothetical protein
VSLIGEGNFINVLLEEVDKPNPAVKLIVIKLIKIPPRE